MSLRRVASSPACIRERKTSGVGARLLALNDGLRVSNVSIGHVRPSRTKGRVGSNGADLVSVAEAKEPLND